MTSQDQKASPEQPASAAQTPENNEPPGGGESVPTRQPSVPEPPAASPAADTSISFEQFMGVDLRVAKVLGAEAVPKSKKLLKVTVDVGTQQRTIVAGIAGAYEPDQLVGRTVIIVANLKPAKLMGIESQGMVLAAGPDGEPPTLIACDESVPAGTRVR